MDACLERAERAAAAEDELETTARPRVRLSLLGIFQVEFLVAVRSRSHTAAAWRPLATLVRDCC